MDSSGHLFYLDGPANVTHTDANPISLNTWYHVALTRDGSGVWRLFKNGAQVATNTAADDLGSSKPLLIGQNINASGGSNAAHLNGYVTDVRIIKGTAQYTSTFTPPTSPLTAISGTSFLFSSTDANLNDYAMQQNLQTAGNAKISTTQQKWGTGSMSFDGTAGTWVQLPASQVPIWGTLDWTIEGWFYVNNYTASSSNGLFGLRNGNNFGSMCLVINNGFLQALASTSSTSWTFNQTASSTILTGTWHHIAMVRKGSTISVYQNGTSIISGSQSGSLYQPVVPFTIGSSNTVNGSGNLTFNGYVSNFRITYGLARYVGSSYTVPTGPFPDQ
jgi:hypothetical protein